MSVLLIVGLGNKGKCYELTRHNLGFLVIDSILKSLGNTSIITKFNAHISEFIFTTTKVIFVKPQTYMNLSGLAISAISHFYKIPADDIIVFYDDLDLPLGKLRYRTDCGSGGHNGIKSIQAAIKNNFHRIKLGIGRPLNQQDVSNYVLSKFSNEEFNTYIEPLLKRIVDSFDLLLHKDFKHFIETVNTINKG